MRIAIDAMGGDNAPDANVRGALLAAKEWTDTDMILVGDEARISALLHEKPTNLHIRHTTEIIGADDEPVKAVRRKKDASMVVAGRMVKEGEAEAMLSSGNTGALMTTGLLVIGRIEGVERPALAQMLPTTDGVGVLVMDLGANMDATPAQLLQYAIMGSLYRQKTNGIERPRVGLLNVGTEEMKGNELTKAAFPLLRDAQIHFVGNVEARDVLGGVCDVLVCDGFVGNILLKSVEGVASTIFSALKKEFTRNTLNKLAASVLAPSMRDFKAQMDYREYGGAPLFGLNGLCVKGHGSSDEKAVFHAIRQTRMMLKSDFIQTISSEFNRKRVEE
jgi:glycerol-3-phosphate acyltransferase PlsX